MQNSRFSMNYNKPMLEVDHEMYLCQPSPISPKREIPSNHRIQDKGINYWEGDHFWTSRTSDLDLDQYDDVVVVPSMSFDAKELAKLTAISHYEERQLFNLIMLRHPRTRIIYLTSLPLDSSIIEYYWKLLPGNIPFSDIRHRLLLFSTYDASPTCLTQKILSRPRLINRIRNAIRDPEKACVTCFACTKWECKLARVLGLPLLGVDGDLHSWWGSKAGSREVFEKTGLPLSPGIRCVWSVDDLSQEIANLWEKHRQTVIVKLNEGFSGQGNALLFLGALDKELKSMSKVEAIKKEFENMRFQCEQENWESFKPKIAQFGCIAELYFENVKSNPSVQCCINTDGEVILLSTHEQMMGGLDNQVYHGCVFPASDKYRLKLQEFGLKIGRFLSQKGVIGHFGVDFVAVPKSNCDNGDLSNGDEEEMDIYVLEINLRQGGTTHPMMTLKLLTEGSYDRTDGLFRSGLTSRFKYYVASDNVINHSYRGFLPHDIIEVFSKNELHYNPETETGTVFHLLGALSEFGKVGLTCIGNSPEEALDIYERTLAALNETAEETKCMLELYNK